MAAVHPAAAPHVLDPDRSVIVVNRIQDAPAALPASEDARQADKGFHAWWPGFPGDIVDASATRFLTGLSS